MNLLQICPAPRFLHACHPDQNQAVPVGGSCKFISLSLLLISLAPPPPISLPSSLQQWFCILFTCCLIFYAHADSYGPNVYRDKYFGVWTQQFLRTFSQRQRHDWETSLERCGSPQGWIGWTQLPVLKIVTTFWHALFAPIYSGRWDGGRGGCEESKFLVLKKKGFVRMWSIYQQKQLRFRIWKKKGGVRWKSSRGNGIKWKCRRELFYGSNNVHPYPSKVWALWPTRMAGHSCCWPLPCADDETARWADIPAGDEIPEQAGGVSDRLDHG